MTDLKNSKQKIEDKKKQEKKMKRKIDSSIKKRTDGQADVKTQPLKMFWWWAKRRRITFVCKLPCFGLSFTVW